MKFIQNWRVILWRSATSWVTAGVHIVIATIGVHWAVLLGVLPFLPFWLQLPIALAVAAVTIAPTLIARVTEQPKLQDKLKGNVDGT